jgi:hypothetical protein
MNNVKKKCRTTPYKLVTKLRAVRGVRRKVEKRLGSKLVRQLLLIASSGDNDRQSSVMHRLSDASQEFLECAA